MFSDALSRFASWLMDLLLWIPKKVFELIMDALASVLEALPVPDFIIMAADAFSGISGNVVFFASKFAIAEGISIYLSALALRFIIRRIPFLG